MESFNEFLLEVANFCDRLLCPVLLYPLKKNCLTKLNKVALDSYQILFQGCKEPIHCAIGYSKYNVLIYCSCNHSLTSLS